LVHPSAPLVLATPMSNAKQQDHTYYGDDANEECTCSCSLVGSSGVIHHQRSRLRDCSTTQSAHLSRGYFVATLRLTVLLTTRGPSFRFFTLTQCFDRPPDRADHAASRPSLLIPCCRRHEAGRGQSVCFHTFACGTEKRLSGLFRKAARN